MKRILYAGLVALLAAPLGYAAPGGNISGAITGPGGAPFRAAFVRAQNVQTKMTMMVLSDNQGKFSTDKLPAGTYEVWATATGYRSDPAKRANVNLREDQAATVDLTMQKASVQWSQLTKYQGGVLLPDGKGKDVVLQQCFNCHAMSKIGVEGRDRDGWLEAIEHMRQVGVANIKPDVADQVAEYLDKIFGPDSEVPKSPAQLPQYQKVKQERDYFSDDALNIVYVDYQLTGEPKDRPGTGKPDKDGNIWMEMGGGLSKLDPATGELHTWRLPDPTRPFIHEILPTPDGSVWLTIEAQNKLAKFDTRTEKFEVYGQNYDGPQVPEMEPNAPWPDVPDTYGITVDQEGNVWFAEFNSRDHHSIGKVDVKTNKITKWNPPSSDSRPRRLKIDSQGMVWFGDYFGANLTRFDPRTQTFKEFKLPGPMPTPYGMGIDHNDNIWYASMYTDVIGKLDPKTGKVTEYPSPYGERGTRDMFEDSQGRIWYGAQPYMRLGYVRPRTPSQKSVAQK